MLLGWERRGTDTEGKLPMGILTRGPKSRPFFGPLLPIELEACLTPSAKSFVRVTLTILFSFYINLIWQ